MRKKRFASKPLEILAEKLKCSTQKAPVRASD